MALGQFRAKFCKSQQELRGLVGSAEFNLQAGLWIRIHFFRIRIQSLMLETNTDPDPIRRHGFNDQKLEKNYSWNFFFFFFLSKTAIYLSLGLHKVCPSYRRSLQFSKEAIQHFKTWTFTNYCLLLWVIFALLDPDSGSGSTDTIEYGSNPDPDPQPCLQGLSHEIKLLFLCCSRLLQLWACGFLVICWYVELCVSDPINWIPSINLCFSDQKLYVC